ncbi:hypothetical protein FRB96_000969 [Tulasnella sp. 330]|nr:hypothetical protein FRB96_000969 [Tulasnella sp. 330]KAG8881899.1 hypothetical protein FRB97_008946 [Tulasnella sp. 331]
MSNSVSFALWTHQHQKELNTCPPPTIVDVSSFPTISTDVSDSFHPVIKEFQSLIEQDPVIYTAFHQMFDQVPREPPYDKDPRGEAQVRHYKEMLRRFDQIIVSAPTFEPNDFVGFPINAILNWPMGTPAGFLAFTNPKVIAQFKKMFDVWSTFLRSPESRYVLTDAVDGWFGPAAREAISNFSDTFICDEGAPYHAFHSWEDFFTRRFKPGIRPIHSPDDDAVITCACESTVYHITHGVQSRDSFWLKGQPYSLDHMLNHDSLARHFVGGTISQAYLSSTDYHRWHSPVAGTIVKAVQVPGAYYAASPAMGFDPSSQCLSQGFLTAMATRALIFIEARNPKIGLMCFMAVGMAEVSTCEIGVKEGQRVGKGEEIGMFHYGGSTHCLIFRPTSNITFMPEYSVGAVAQLNTCIATVS